jgi:outer membrane protein assembly factor BamA
MWLKFRIGLGDFVPDGSTETISFDLKGESKILMPVSDRLTLSLAVDGGYFGLASGTVPLSKKLRYGGAASLRGYREEEFVADWVIISQLEIRYRVSSENSFYTFIDGSYDEQKRTPASVGLGLKQKTPMGVLQLDYAIGKDNKPKEGKIHIRIINRF